MTLEILPRERLVFEGARQIKDGDCVIVGTGLPLLAALVAQRTHAPNSQLIIESGAIFPRVVPTPISVVDPRIMNGSSRLGSLLEVLGGFVQRGLVATGFVGGAQIDEHANINSTWVRRDTEWVRLPGSGGANDIASHCGHVVILITHELRRFPRRCDYVTSPGFLSGPGARRRAGLGPMRVKVVTDLCVMEGDDEVGRLTLTKIMPGVTVETVLSRTGFRPLLEGEPTTVASPPAEHITLLRTDLDPAGKYFPERKETSSSTTADQERELTA